MSISLVFSQGGDLEMVEGASPLDLVVRILNNQLTSLMWIDEKVFTLVPF
jgi:nuclear pore complex protein Nup62